jgi:hypothetical protein
MKNEEIVPKVLNPTGGKDRWMNLEELTNKKTSSLEDQMLRKLNFTPPKKS